MRTASVFSAVVALLLLAGGGQSQKRTWTFEDAEVGKLPPGWSSAKTGKGPGSEWKVLQDKSAPSGRKVLAQTSSRGPNRLFNLCVAETTSYKDFDLTVAFKANTGKFDQGGGPLWRYQDSNNYYLCRFNPLEDNFRIYKVLAGKRTQLGSLRIRADAGKWHRIRVLVRGGKFVCSLNNRQLTVYDNSITKAGRVGLWTKADAVTYFDDLSVTAVRQERR